MTEVRQESEDNEESKKRSGKKKSKRVVRTRKLYEGWEDMKGGRYERIKATGGRRRSRVNEKSKKRSGEYKRRRDELALENDGA